MLRVEANFTAASLLNGATSRRKLLLDEPSSPSKRAKVPTLAQIQNRIKSIDRKASRFQISGVVRESLGLPTSDWHGREMALQSNAKDVLLFQRGDAAKHRPDVTVFSSLHMRALFRRLVANYPLLGIDTKFDFTALGWPFLALLATDDAHNHRPVAVALMSDENDDTVPN
jgi:hypothetical protein